MDRFRSLRADELDCRVGTCNDNDKVNVLQSNVEVQERFIKELCQRVADKDDKNKHKISESDAADILSEWMYGEAVKRPERTHE